MQWEWGLTRMFFRPFKRPRQAARPVCPRGYAGGEGGAAAMEFTLVLPVLLLLLFAVLQMGIIFNHYIELANGVSAAARSFAVSRGSTTPYTNMLTALHSGAPNLNPFSTPMANQTLNVTVNSAACNGDSSCATALVQGATASISATYPCNFNIPWVTMSGCALTSSASEYVQ